MHIKDTLWDKPPHTEAKHDILRKYLAVWIPILGSRGSNLIYIDGFAGPGEYIKKCTEEKEIGSPIIALNALEDQLNKLHTNIHFLFVEQNKNRCDNLKKVLSTYSNLENAIIEEPVCGDFNIEVSKVLDQIEDNIKTKNEKTGKKYRRVPTFAFIDPFGYKAPMSLIKRIMESRQSEILVTLVIPSFKRWCGITENEERYNEFFGTDEWKKICKSKLKSKEKNRLIRELYVNQLHDYANIKHTLYFEMINKHNQVALYLIFGTNYWLGIEKMKNAMWKVDPTGNYTFSDLTNPNQSTIMDFSNEDLIFSSIRKELRKLSGKILPLYGKYYKNNTVEEYIALETPYPTRSLRTGVLKPMELADPPGIKVHYIDNRRPGTFPERCKCEIEFL